MTKFLKFFFVLDCAIATVMLLTSCSSMPLIFRTLDDLATEEAIEVSVSKDAIQDDTDIAVDIRIQNKDNPKLPVAIAR